MSEANRKLLCILPLVALGFLVGGCHSAFVEADIRNASPAPIRLVELDYPSASFGTGSLASGATYHYRFKILGQGQAKLLWTDASRREHTQAGPQLREGQQGSLVVVVNGDAASWTMNLHP